MKPIYSVMRVLVVVFAAGLLVACGGSGGAESGPPSSNEPPVNPPANPPANPPVSPSLKLVVASTIVDVTASTADAAPTRSVTVSIANTTASSAVYLSGSYSTNGIQSAQLAGTGAGGSLVINFRSPGLLAPGTYTDTVNVRACLESPCVTHIQDSPVAVAVTYTVTAAPVMPTVVTFNNTNATIQASNLSNSSSHLLDQSIGFTISNPIQGMSARFTIASGGAVVYGAAINWDDRKLMLYMQPPSALGAGTYTDSVKIDFCLDFNCNVLAQGSPVDIAVAYQVTGSANPNITLDWSQSAITGADMIESDTRSPKLTLTLWPSPSVPNGIHVRHTASATGLIASVNEISYAHASIVNPIPGKYDLILKSPAILGSGSFTDTMEFEACFDVACANPVPDGKYTVTVNVVIAAAQLRRRIVSGINGASDLVWSQASQSLYVINNSGTDHRVSRLDPVTLAITPGPALEVGAAHQSLQHLTVTPDGSYLYTGSGYNPVLYRLQLPSMTPDLVIPLDSLGGSSVLVNDLATIPGQPQSIVVARNGNNPYRIVVYDNATARPTFVPINPAQAFENPRWLVPAETPGTFITQNYGLSYPKVNNLEQVTVDAAGISTTSSSPTGHEFFFPKPVRAGTKLFTRNGEILDATTGAIIGTLPGFGSYTAKALVVDEARGRLFVWTDVNTREHVLSYDLATLQVLGYAQVYDFPAQTSGSGNMVLWGNEGLALVDNSGRIILLSGAFFSM